MTRLAREPNELKKKLLLLGYLTRLVSDKGGSLFLVGGQAVETYTGGVFTTGDIDITTTEPGVVEDALRGLGFAESGMVWMSGRLGMAVHVVAPFPSKSDKARTIFVDGFSVKVVGVEDLIVDRLAAAKFWKSERDMEQAIALLRTFVSSIDYEYLRTAARERTVSDALRRATHRERRRTLGR